MSATPLDYANRSNPPARGWLASDASMPVSIGIMLVRLIVGVVFVMHGYQKWFVYTPAGTVHAFGGMGFPAAAYMAMTAELGCGILLVLGLLTRLAAIPILITMIVAIAQVHLHNGFFILGDPTKPGFEYALTLGVAALALILMGPGTLAVDNLLRGRR